MNCNGYLDVEFASYLVIDNSMPVSAYTNLNSIPLSIAVNTDNLNFYKTEEVYNLPQTVTLPNPCSPNDPSKGIAINEVTLNTIKATGYIGYYAGANVLNNSSNATLSTNSTPSNPSTTMTYGTVAGRVFIPDLDFLIQEDPTLPIPQVTVSVQEFEVSSTGVNDGGEHYFLLTGYFRITPNA